MTRFGVHRDQFEKFNPEPSSRADLHKVRLAQVLLKKDYGLTEDEIMFLESNPLETHLAAIINAEERSVRGGY